ncbi:hypothetical protein AVM02_09335 [Brucella anthropi]|uniref:hypothetical protein n=1 Tax=Brucella anthropi TaxID=529 RepID=UPI003987F4F6
MECAISGGPHPDAQYKPASPGLALIPLLSGETPRPRSFMQDTIPGRALRALARYRVAARSMGMNADPYSTPGFAPGAMLAGTVSGLTVAITGVNSMPDGFPGRQCRGRRKRAPTQ